MIEVLKQALEALKDVGVLTDREWQAVHKNKANELRQAIAELESQEPIGYAVPTFDFDNSIIYKVHYEHTVPLYTHPPQRTWVGLTDEEIEDLYFDKFSMGELKAFAKAIEAKLKQKNGYGEENT